MSKAKIMQLGMGLLVLVVILGATILVYWYRFSSHASSQSATPTTNATWRVIPHVQRETMTRFNGIAARTATDIWAVGSSGPVVASSHTLIEHCG